MVSILKCELLLIWSGNWSLLDKFLRLVAFISSMKFYAFSDNSFISNVSAESTGKFEETGDYFFFKIGLNIGSGFWNSESLRSSSFDYSGFIFNNKLSKNPSLILQCPSGVYFEWLRLALVSELILLLKYKELWSLVSSIL